MAKNVLLTFPSTLPPDFIPNVLASILPDPLTLHKREALIEYHHEAARLTRSIRDNPLRFFVPNPGGQAEFMEFEDPDIQGLYFFAGNKTGKCVEHNEILTLWDGQRHRAGELIGQTFQIPSLDAFGRPVAAQAYAELNSPAEPVYRVTTKFGRTIIRNGEHPLWAATPIAEWRHGKPVFRVKGWTALMDLAEGDLVAVTEELPVFGNAALPDPEIKLLAYLIGDGGLTNKDTVNFTQVDNAQLAEMGEVAEAFDCHLHPRGRTGIDFAVVGNGETRLTTSASPSGKTTHRLNRVLECTRKHGIQGKHSRDKRIPDAVWQLPKMGLATFLSRLYSTDGWAYCERSAKPRCPEIGYASASHGLIQDIQELLIRFGIASRIDAKPHTKSWSLIISSEPDLLRFAKEIGIFGKEPAVLRVVERVRNNVKHRNWRTRYAPVGTRWEAIQSIERLPNSATIAISVPGPNTFLTTFWEHNTTAAVIKAIERACGKPLWGLPRRAGLRWKQPTMGALFCEDFDTHRTDLLPRFFTWCPANELAQDPLEMANGEPARILFKNGSVIYLRTYQQGYEKHEGKDYDWVLCNEPVSRDIYTAIWRGFTATEGIMFIAATLLSQVWLYDEMAHPFIKVIDASIYENKWLSAQAVANFAAGLSDEEKDIRLLGKPSNLSGKVYSNFRDRFPFVVGNFNPVPWDVGRDKPWPIVMGVDPHERKPLHVAWAYVSPRNEIIWFDWALIPAIGGLTAVFEQLDAREREHHHASTLVIMDPNRGKAIQLGGSSWQEAFEEHDYPVMLGLDDISFGHAQVRDYLYGSEPRMRWTEDCRGKDGPLWQMERYVFADRARGTRFGSAQKETVQDIAKDFPDVIRYVAAAHLEYRLLVRENNGTLLLNNRTPSSRNPYLERSVSSPLDSLINGGYLRN